MRTIFIGNNTKRQGVMSSVKSKKFYSSVSLAAFALMIGGIACAPTDARAGWNPFSPVIDLIGDVGEVVIDDVGDFVAENAYDAYVGYEYGTDSTPTSNPLDIWGRGPMAVTGAIVGEFGDMFGDDDGNSELALGLPTAELGPQAIATAERLAAEAAGNPNANLCGDPLINPHPCTGETPTTLSEAERAYFATMAINAAAEAPIEAAINAANAADTPSGSNYSGSDNRGLANNGETSEKGANNSVASPSGTTVAADPAKTDSCLTVPDGSEIVQIDKMGYGLSTFPGNPFGYAYRYFYSNGKWCESGEEPTSDLTSLIGAQKVFVINSSDKIEYTGDKKSIRPYAGSCLKPPKGSTGETLNIVEVAKNNTSQTGKYMFIYSDSEYCVSDEDPATAVSTSKLTVKDIPTAKFNKDAWVEVTGSTASEENVATPAPTAEGSDSTPKPVCDFAAVTDCDKEHIGKTIEKLSDVNGRWRYVYEDGTECFTTDQPSLDLRSKINTTTYELTCDAASTS